MISCMAEASETIGIGILGAAVIAKKTVKAIAKANTGIEVVAVGSRSKAKAEAFIEACALQSSVTAYGSYDEVITAANVAAVYIPLPTALHLQWVRRAAACKKHILLEKPIALTLKETDDIVEACKAAGVQLMDGTMFVHNPRTAAMHQLITQQKALGPLISVTSTFTWKASEDFLKNDVRTKKDADALGCYGDIGWYCIRAALWAFGYDKPAYVQAHPSPKINNNGVVMHGGGTIVWKDGRRLTFDCGFDAVHSMYLQIAGSIGMLELKDFCIPYRPEECSYTLKGPGTWHDHDTWIEQDIKEVQISLHQPQETFMWEEFSACVLNCRRGGSPNHSFADHSALCNKLCIAVELSAQQHSKIIDVSQW